MKKSKFTEAQIVFALRQAEQGVRVAEVCRKMGISETTYYNGKKKWGYPNRVASSSSRKRTGSSKSWWRI